MANDKLIKLSLDFMQIFQSAHSNEANIVGNSKLELVLMFIDDSVQEVSLFMSDSRICL